MSGAMSATVETITAEVRVLMVGSRQVTLSVAKQLDEIPLSKLRPFGRVKLSPHIELIIGADAETNVLCLSSMEYKVPETAHLVLPDDQRRLRPIMCDARCRDRDVRYDDKNHRWLFTSDGWPCSLPYIQVELRHKNGRMCWTTGCSGIRQDGTICEMSHHTAECEHFDLRDYREAIENAVEKHIKAYQDEAARIEAAEKLPLIVLAGLR